MGSSLGRQETHAAVANEGGMRVVQVTHAAVANEGGMRVVKIQDLEAVDDDKVTRNTGHGRRADTESLWKRKKCQHDKCNVLAYMETAPASFNNHQNSFFGAFLAAYNTHQDLLLAPDDVWLLICLHFSKYVNDNAEALRRKLVSHEGKKNLTVTTWNEGSESQWEEFLSLIKIEIEKNTKGNVVEMLQSNFTTTSLVERMISTASIMDSFKQYFSYGRCIPLCGIRNACFLGSLEDWQSIVRRSDGLLQFDVDGKWKSYIRGLNPILQQLISTYQGEVDVAWWNKVMNMETGREGSGSTTKVSGWVLRFFGLEDKCDTDDISSYSIDVPVKIDNKMTGEKKTVHMVGGFGGVHAVDMQGRKAYRPQTSMIVLHDPTSEDDKQQALRHFP